MIRYVRDHAIRDMYNDLLDMPKYEFLLETLPEFTQRPWLETLPRGLRIYVARYMLSQHRMPIEVGRWTKQDRTERTCTHCRNTGKRCGLLCKCIHPHRHKC